MTALRNGVPNIEIARGSGKHAFVRPQIAELLNESDVEQKLIYPLLTAEAPYGFEIPKENIFTKRNVRRFLIGKGTAQKSYFPDYLIVRACLALMYRVMAR